MKNEQWRPIPDHPGYTASSHGRIKNQRGQILVPSSNKNDRINPTYAVTYQITLRHDGGRTTKMALHYVIALAFLGPLPPHHTVQFRDGNRDHVVPSNLYYTLRSHRSTQFTSHHGSADGRGHPRGNYINAIWHQLLPALPTLRARLEDLDRSVQEKIAGDLQ